MVLVLTIIYLLLKNCHLIFHKTTNENIILNFLTKLKWFLFHSYLCKFNKMHSKLHIHQKYSQQILKGFIMIKSQMKVRPKN